ncbi:MAG: phosphoglycerate kinase [Geminicoccaceae bacterium]|nr:phosphoglycerate kinase [Geminicoccaceae bacterium]
MTAFRTLDALDAKDRRVLVRVDFNVPMQDGEITDGTRIERGLPTIRELADKGAKVIVMAHFGRPKGRAEPSMSLKPVAEAVGEALGREVAFASDCVGPVAAEAVADLPPGGVLMLENLRFHAGEEKNDPAFAQALADLGDAYVNDAFSCSHRAHASVVGVAERLPAFAGRLMQAEVEALDEALGGAARPAAALVGGAKVSTKLDVLGLILDKVDIVVIGGGMANTFLHAKGEPIGKSLAEKEMAPTALEIMAKAKAKGVEILLPVDAVVAKEFKPNPETRACAVDEVAEDEMILDIGPRSVDAVARKLGEARTLLWNGPMGAFEVPPFDVGTNRVAVAAAELTRTKGLKTVAGGGDTVAALVHAGVLERFSYVSTAGGAFLEFLEGKVLPGIAALESD